MGTPQPGGRSRSSFHCVIIREGWEVGGQGILVMGVLVNADGDQQAVNIWGLLLSFFFFLFFSSLFFLIYGEM